MKRISIFYPVIQTVEGILEKIHEKLLEQRSQYEIRRGSGMTKKTFKRHSFLEKEEKNIIE